MTIKVNGGIQKGAWFERKVDFVTLTFDADITDMTATDGDGSSAFGKPDTILDNVVQKLVQQKGVVLAVSDVYADGPSFKVDLMLGHAQGWTASSTGVIAASSPVSGKVYDVDGVYVGTATANVVISMAKFEGLAAATSGDLVEFPVGSGAYFSKD